MGNADSVLTPEKIAELDKNSHFTAKEIQKVLSYYAQYDKSPNGQDGIAIEDLSEIPELCGCPFSERIIFAYLDRPSMTLKAESFLKIFSVLSSRATAQEKTRALFDCLDCSHDGSLGFDELFRFYKSVLNPAVDDQYIVDLVVRILERPENKPEYRLSFDEFQKMITEDEIKEKMTVDLQLTT